jgi:hypothetical protein
VFDKLVFLIGYHDDLFAELNMELRLNQQQSGPDQ